MPRFFTHCVVLDEFILQGQYTAPTLHPAALSVIMTACVENTTPHLQALCLGTFLKLVCTPPRDAVFDHHGILLENVRPVCSKIHCRVFWMLLCVRVCITRRALQGLMVIMRELAARFSTLYDNVRQLYGSLLVKLTRRGRNHPSLVSGMRALKIHSASDVVLVLMIVFAPCLCRRWSDSTRGNPAGYK